MEHNFSIKSPQRTVNANRFTYGSPKQNALLLFIFNNVTSVIFWFIL